MRTVCQSAAEPAQPADEFVIGIALREPSRRHRLNRARVEHALDPVELTATIPPGGRKVAAPAPGAGGQDQLGDITVVIHSDRDAERLPDRS
ncbi:MAG TPA: hypothetical protein VFG20_06185 [Planctomycetaceae bacterium]|nr:hypothetical protein [Planctomycetaceae bacterium]